MVSLKFSNAFSTKPKGFDPPPEVRLEGETAYVTGTDGDDTWTIRSDPKTGSTYIRNGNSERVAEVPTKNGDFDIKNVVFDTGDGDDEVHILSERLGANIFLDMEEPIGDDMDLPIDLGATTNYHFNLGAGNDLFVSPFDHRPEVRVHGDAGNDIIVGAGQADGGDGDDVLKATLIPESWPAYKGVRLAGGAGNDRIVGGDGNDLLEGGPGRDRLEGGAGTDVISGGSGDDEIYGESVKQKYQNSNPFALNGDRSPDYLYGLEGNDTIWATQGSHAYGGAGNDRLHVTQGPASYTYLDGGTGNNSAVGPDKTISVGVPNHLDQPVTVDRTEHIFRGFSDVEVEHILNDLATLKGIGFPLPEKIIFEKGSSDEVRYLSMLGSRLNATDYGQGDPNAVVYLTLRAHDVSGDGTTEPMPTVVTLAHELVHLWEARNGALDLRDGQTDGESNDERTAVGLTVDHDRDPSTPRIHDAFVVDDEGEPWNENRVREALGLPRRTSYKE